MRVIRANVSVAIPVQCDTCGQRAMSEPISFEMSGCNLDDMAETLRSVKLGTHFPVGWAKFYPERLKCPYCLEKCT